MESICRDAIGLLSRQAEKKTLHVKLKVDSRIGAIKADRRRLRQILFNLLSNAVKFTPDGKSIGLEVYLKDKKTACFTVWDEGIGIAPEDQKKLFQPFVQIDSKLSRKFEGTGLGLHLVKRLVEMHGGSTKLESKEGEGSRLHVLLPWSRQDASDTKRARSGDESSINLVKAPVSSRPMVLMVEDNQMNQQSITQYLEAHKFDILVAGDGPTALRLAEAEDFDLILMDVQMPGMDGLECTRELRSRSKTKEIPIIAVTAMVMDGDRERCLEAGANDYLSKPLDLKQLVRIANQHAGRTQGKDA
ncbi:MAG: response regulator [Limisphaerales bacterium]